MSVRIGTSSRRLTTRSALLRNLDSSARPGRPIAGGHHHKTVGGFEGLIGHDLFDAGAVPPRDFAIGEVGRDRQGHPGQRGLVERGVDHPASAGALALL